MPIQILPSDVANQIAAGEVVERPASVVKELLENSLDAGATDVRVEVREGGRRLIRVQDNGAGIAATETEFLFHRHATSKIREAGDLVHLRTLGFRGEALASIGSVAQVTLQTCTRGEPVGTLVRISGGTGMERMAVAAVPGTNVTVEHLFANVPARLKFLKQAPTEAGHILQVVTRYALAYPECRFSLVSDGRLAFQSTGNGKLYDVLVKVYGLETARQLLPLPEAEFPDGQPAADGTLSPPIAVTGYVGAPQLHRSNRNYITLFVNRRWFQDTTVAYGVIQAYHTLLPSGRYPFAVLLIQMAPEEVDVNVHPTKAEVRFRDGRAVFTAVQRPVRRALISQAPVPQVSLGSGVPLQTPMTWQEAGSWAARRDVLLAAGRGEREPAPSPGPGEPGEALTPVAPGPQLITRIPLLRVVGQLGATYIVAEGPDGMYLIDQHAAHERVLFERLLAEQSADRLAVQPLLEPVVLDCTPEQAAAVGEEMETLRTWGFDIEPFGGHSYLLRSVPAVLGRGDPQRALGEVVDDLTQNRNGVQGNHEGQLATIICKRAAVKGGQVLSVAEMQELVRDLERCRSPRTCPHGRPTMITLSAAELARQFGRT